MLHELATTTVTVNIGILLKANAWSILIINIGILTNPTLFYCIQNKQHSTNECKCKLGINNSNKEVIK